MTYNRKQRRPHRRLAVISCACYLGAAFSNRPSPVLVTVVAASSSGILPPPPPPPPPRDARKQERTLLAESAPPRLDSDAALSESSAASSEKKSDGDEGEGVVPIEAPEKITDGGILTPIISPETKITDDDATKYATWEKRRDEHESQSACETVVPLISAEQQSQPRPPQADAQKYYPKSEQWSSGDQTSSQYSGHYYDQQQWQQHQKASSWGQGYQHQSPPQQQTPQQQQYYQPQQYQQQHQHPGSSQQQLGQLSIYNRRPTQAAPKKKSASSLFSFAVKKLQTGIDTVSESIDVEKVTSGVSSLTSRIGHIGGNIVGGVSGKGGGALPHQTRPGPRGRPVAGGGSLAGRGPPRQQQQSSQYPQQRTTPTVSRQQQHQQQQQQQGSTKTKEIFAPPMSELYSLGQQQEGKGAVAESADNGDTDLHHRETDMDTTDGEGEDGAFPDIMRQKTQQGGMRQQPATTTESAQTRPNNGPSPSFRRESLPRGKSIPPRQQPAGGRRPQPSSSSLLRRNGGSMTPPATAAARRRQQRHYSDDDDGSSIGHKLRSVLGACAPRVPRLFKRSTVIHDDGAWSDDESSYTAAAVASRGSSSSRYSSGGKLSAVVPPPVQSLLGKRATLLSAPAARRCASVGRIQAVLDVARLALVVCILNEAVPIIFRALTAEAAEGGTRAAILSALLSAMDGWAPFALAATILLSATNGVWIKPALKSVYEEATSENAAEAAYAQIYLRLTASTPMRSKSGLKEAMGRTARATATRAASSARLRSFATLSAIYVLLSTVSVLQPAAAAAVSTLADVVGLRAWRDRPIEWKVVREGMKNVGLSLGQNLHSLFLTEWNIVREQPLRVAVVVTLLTALLSISYLPSLIDKFKFDRGFSSNNKEDEAEEEDDAILSLWSNIGASSATRLGIMSSPRGAEGALEQFAKLRPDRASSAGISLPGKGPKLRTRKKNMRRSESLVDLRSSLQPLLRKAMYSASSFLLLSVPLAIYLYIFASTSLRDGEPLSLSSIRAIPEDGWMALSQLAVLLLFTHFQATNALNDVLCTNVLQQGRSSVSSFFRKLGETIEELRRIAEESSAGADFQAMLTASPTRGIEVTDLWAAHASRRAWAVKGANVQCQSGEVVMILGADGSGKTRLLTSVAERIFVPPRSARTTTHVRGSVTVGGVDLSKWDKTQLQKRVGVCLNDVRTVSDCASLVAGCTIEEILEPVVAGGRVGQKERNAVAVAMKITGLGNTLSRLPSKLSTVVSAHEDELKPSSSRPYPSYPLSPSDWSRVLLTKALAQLISGNEARPTSSSSPGDDVRNCMTGSVLLLDDATSQMSEVDEADLIAALRRTGAAVLLTSNRWASGRFADRVVVLGDGGGVAESGTHADLIGLGPERSLYAREWGAMASA